MKSLLNAMYSWRFDKKMSFFVTMTITITLLAVLGFFTIALRRISVNQSKNILEDQLSSLSLNYGNTFLRYKEMALALTLDSAMQNYLVLDKDADSNRYYAYASLASDTLEYLCRLDSSIRFLAVVNARHDDYLYKGNRNLGAMLFASRYERDLAFSKSMDGGMIRMHIGDAYTKDGSHTFNIYFPIFSTTVIGRQLGTLCICVGGEELDHLFTQVGKYDSAIRLVDASGTILLDRERDEVGTPFPLFSLMQGTRGSFSRNGKLYIYRKIGRWNYYLVQYLSLNALGRDFLEPSLIVSCLVLVIVTLSLLSSHKLVEFAYRPMESLVKAMDAVRGGRLDIRMDETKMGEDFTKLAVGFNAMMGRLTVLVEQVREKQRQEEQLRFKALQSQIKPHFLYNTLECIHWKAIADGNEDVSTLVMALASYYRICLSNGKEIITLQEEIQHVENYLIIQKMRYGPIIESEIVMDASLENVRIPKISLQPLVENAIYHGLRVKDGRSGFVKVVAEAVEKGIWISVIDDGGTMTEAGISRMNAALLDRSEVPGFGIRNVNRRIQLLFGKQFGLHFCRNERNGVTVRVWLPDERGMDDVPYSDCR